MLFSDERTHSQERRASARRGVRETRLQQRRLKVAGDCRHYAHERQRIRVERRRKGPTLIPAPALRDFQSLSSRAGFPRGAYAPRSCIAARTLVGEKTIFAMHKRMLAQERRA
jgi:hypothetical protein